MVVKRKMKTSKMLKPCDERGSFDTRLVAAQWKNKMNKRLRAEADVARWGHCRVLSVFHCKLCGKFHVTARDAFEEARKYALRAGGYSSVKQWCDDQ